MNSPQIRKVLALLLAGALFLAAPGCAARSAGSRVSEPEVSRTLNPFIHYEGGSELFIAVDGRAAQYIKDEPIFPLGLGLSNLSARRSFKFNRESFVLETATGERFPLVSLQEFQRDYERSRADRRLADELSSIMATRYNNFTLQPWTLFPAAGENVPASTQLELARRQWTRNYLYFPVPKSGLHGQAFALLVTPLDHDETFVVRFSLR